MALDHPMTRQALDKGYQWVRDKEDNAQLTRRVTGRMAITNYDPGSLSNDERRRLHLEEDRHPRNYVFVDVRSGYPGGGYPWHGQIKLRSFNAILGFLARGISDELEFDVEPDARSGPAPRNPVRTLAITESNSRPSDTVFAAKLDGRWYSIDGEQEGNE